MLCTEKACEPAQGSVLMEGQRWAGRVFLKRHGQWRFLSDWHREAGETLQGAELTASSPVFEIVLGDVPVREPLRNTFFRCYLCLLIMREADIPHMCLHSPPGSSSQSGDGNEAGRLRHVCRRNVPANKQAEFSYIPVIERKNRNTAKSDNLAAHTELLSSTFTICLSPF